MKKIAYKPEFIGQKEEKVWPMLAFLFFAGCAVLLLIVYYNDLLNYFWGM